MSSLLFFFLLAARNLGIWGYVLRWPAAVTWRSFATIAADTLLPLLGAVFLLALMWGAGTRMMAWMDLGPRSDGPQEPPGVLRACMAFGLGLGAAATGVFILGLIGAYRGWVMLVAGAAFAALAAPELRRPLLAGGWRPRWGRPLPFWKALLAGLMAYAAWHAAVHALAPVTQWDVLAYHLALPKLYLRTGAVREVPWLLHSHWPHLMETLYGAALAWGKDNAAALLHAGACGALVLAVFAAARSELDASTAWTGAALLAAQPVLLRLAGTAHSDGALALFYFLCACAVWRWAKTGRRAWMVLAGLLGGFAASAKLLGLTPVLVLAGWAYLRAARAKAADRWAPAVFLLCAGGVVLPWYLKSWIGAGNPVWPFLSGIFGGKWGASEIAAAHLRTGHWSWPPDPAVLLRYAPQYLLAPAAILVALAAFRRALPPPFLRFLLVQAALFAPLVFRHNEGWRYFLPFFPALALSAAWSAARLVEANRAFKAAAILLIAFGLYPATTVSQNNQLFPVLGLRSLSEPGRDPRALYLERSLDHYRFFREASRRLGPKDKVLLFREIRGYHLDADYQWGDPLNQGMIVYKDIPDPDELWDLLGELDVSHVLVNERLAMYRLTPGYYDAHTLELMEGVLERHARPVLREDGLALFAL
ncbi:MAG: phospholipid carrier-dependent glycosyltransferase [Elusimicrobiota bacterium]